MFDNTQMQKNKKIMIFAGTTEGRKLAEYLSARDAQIFVCVATEYGESLLPKGDNIVISHDRMNQEEMTAAMQSFAPDCVVDATHPYAHVVTENLKLACENCGRKYLRLVREESEVKDCIFVENVNEAVAYLQETTGNILVTTGSKELEAYTAISDYENRIYARVLSLASVVQKCEDLKIVGQHLICMQGPFSVEMNVAMLRQYQICWMVSKESGKTGGFPEKCEAAREAGAKLIVIGRPAAEEGYSLDEICKILVEKLELSDMTLTDNLTDNPELIDAISNGQLPPFDTSLAEKRRVSIVGIGPGAEDYLTVRAKNVIEDADLFIGAKRMTDAALAVRNSQCGTRTAQAVREGHCEAKVVNMYKAEEIFAYIQEHAEYKKIAVLLSGDVGFYSGSKKLLELLRMTSVARIVETSSKEVSNTNSEIEVEVIPGISSVVYFCAKLGIAWEDARLLSIHGKQENVISEIRDHNKVILLAGNEAGIQTLGEDLEKYGYEDMHIFIGENLSYADERIVATTAKGLKQYEGKGLAVILIDNPDGGARVRNSGMPDEMFIRGDVPMTKEEVRSVSLSKMQIREDDVIYDVGAGTGSVSVEAALLATKGHVYAIEVKEEAAELIQKNSCRFETDNLTVVHGSAPEALEGLPRPDVVFIGGTKGNLREILNKVTTDNPHVRIVINAITLETLTEAIQCVKDMKEAFGTQITDEEILQVAASKSKNIGNYHMMMGQNPIYIISFTYESSDAPS